MTTQQVVAPAVVPATERRTRNAVPWLIGAIVVLVIAVVALGAMLVAPALSTPSSQAMVDANIAAWNTPAADKLLDFYADNAVLWASDSTTPSATGIDEIVKLAQYGNFTIERLGPVSERGNLVWYLAHVSNDYDVSGSDAVVVYYMQDGKVKQQWVIWDEL